MARINLCQASAYSTPNSIGFLLVLAIIFFISATAYGQTPEPSLSKSFSPSTIGPGSSATLTFTINAGTAPVTDVSFDDIMPAAITVTAVESAVNECGGNLSIADGSNSISLTDVRLGAGKSCKVKVLVTASTPGTHENDTGDLNYAIFGDGASVSGASADLIVSADRPGFSKSFSPQVISPGGVSTLTFTVDNTANGSNLINLDFTDVLPSGVIIASPANASTTCGTATIPPTLTAVAKTQSIRLDANGTGAFPAVNAGASCTVTVDVESTTSGVFSNVSEELISEDGITSLSSGIATATLSAPGDVLSKSFIDDPVGPGETVILEFNINNPADLFNGRNGAGDFTEISFSDNLSGVVSGLTYNDLVSDNCGGTLVDNSNVLTYTGGQLASGSSCKIEVLLDVAGTTSTGSFNSETGNISYDVNEEPVIGNKASDVLRITVAPTLNKNFTDDPVGPGDNVTLRFTIQNNSATSAATEIAFTDELTTFLPFPIVASLPSDGFCGAGSNVALISFGTDRQGLSVTGASLAAGADCSFDVTITVPATDPEDGGVANGVFTNTTSSITALIDGGTVEGLSASDDLVIGTAPSLEKVFSLNQVSPGGSVDLTFSLSNDENAAGDASSIAFTDAVDLTRLSIPGGTLSTGDCGGTLVNNSGTLEFNGGTLSIGSSCSFAISLGVLSTAPSGTFTNTTSIVTANLDIGGNSLPVSNSTASDILEIQSISFSKEFTNDPVVAGNTTNLRFTISNETDQTLTDISFTDDLEDMIEDMAAPGLPVSGVCGTGSSLNGSAGNSLLTLLDGTLGPNETCTFDVAVTVPAAAEEAEYTNATSEITADLNGDEVTAPAAEDDLVVSDVPNILTLSKSFLENPVFPGDEVTLQFDITFLGGTNATNISFTDDLNAVITGLAATSLPADGFCGVGSTISGAGLLTVSGASLPAPNGQCSFQVTLQVPITADPGTYTNTTTTITANGGIISGNQASDDLTLAPNLRPPTADAGPDQTIICVIGNEASVTLDGSGSTSENPPILTYVWTVDDTTEIAAGVNPTVILPLGVNIVQLTVTDEYDSATDEVVINIIPDTEDPSISCPPDVVVCDGDLIDLGSPIVSDNCDPNPNVTDDRPGTFPVGTTTVTYTVIDASGNSAQCTQTVTVNPNPTVSITESNLDEFCQGAEVFLTANSPTATSYNWSTGETTQTTRAGLGPHTVTVFDANGCSATESYTVIFDPQDLLSAYIILSQEDVTFDHNQVVVNGGVGVFDPDKKIKLDHNSTLNGATTFAIASEIEIKNGSAVSNPIIGQPTVSLPTFKTNENPQGDDIKVPKGTMMTLELSSYKKVEVEEDATAIFTASTVQLEELITKKRGTIEVADCSELIVKKDFILDEDSDFNMGDNNVIIYAKKADIKKGSNVIADIYTSDDIKADGDDEQPITMTGFFIGKKVTGDHYVTWDWKEDCSCGGGSGGNFTSEEPSTFDYLTSNGSKINVRPNPFTNLISVIISSEREKTNYVQLRILNTANQEVFSRKIMPGEKRFDLDASTWNTGVFFIQLIGQNDMETVKVIRIK